LYSLRFQNRQVAGNHYKFEIIDFNYEKGIVHYYRFTDKVKERKVELCKGTQDTLSCLYFFRANNNSESGGPAYIKVNSEGKNYDLEVKVLRREELSIRDLGTFEATVIEPIAKYQGDPVKKGEMVVWFSNDEKRLPLLMKTRIPLGSLDASLVKVENSLR
jgi:hypothetical protein